MAKLSSVTQAAARGPGGPDQLVFRFSGFRESFSREDRGAVLLPGPMAYYRLSTKDFGEPEKRNGSGRRERGRAKKRRRR